MSRDSLLYKCAVEAESKDGTTQVVMPYRLNGFEILCLWNCNISIQRTAITQSNMEMAGIALQQRRIYYNVKSSQFVFYKLCFSAQPRGPPVLPTVPTHPMLLPALSSHLKTQAHNPRPSVCFFWGNYDICDKKYHQSCQPSVSALITWGTPHLHNL